jgi:ribosomal protein L40E
MLFAAWRIGNEVMPRSVRPDPVCLFCEKCRAQYEGLAKGRPPYRCTKCGAPNAWVAATCSGCKSVFGLRPAAQRTGDRTGPPLLYGPDDAAQPILCPKCTAARAGPAMTDS